MDQQAQIELLIRIDERTASIDERMAKLEETATGKGFQRCARHETQLNEVSSRVIWLRNTFVGGILIAILLKVL